MGVLHGGRFVQEGLDIAGHTGDQSHLDEDQGLVGHPGMEEREAAPIRFEPVLQVLPARMAWTAS